MSDLCKHMARQNIRNGINAGGDAIVLLCVINYTTTKERKPGALILAHEFDSRITFGTNRLPKLLPHKERRLTRHIYVNGDYAGPPQLILQRRPANLDFGAP